MFLHFHHIDACGQQTANIVDSIVVCLIQGHMSQIV